MKKEDYLKEIRSNFRKDLGGLVLAASMWFFLYSCMGCTVYRSSKIITEDLTKGIKTEKCYLNKNNKGEIIDYYKLKKGNWNEFFWEFQYRTLDLESDGKVDLYISDDTKIRKKNYYIMKYPEKDK